MDASVVGEMNCVFRFDKQRYVDIFKNARGQLEGNADLPSLTRKLAQENMPELAKGIEKMAYTNHVQSLNEEEFLALCHWQEKVIHIVQFHFVNSEGYFIIKHIMLADYRTPENFKLLLNTLGLQTTDEEAQKLLNIMSVNGRPCDCPHLCKSIILVEPPLKSLDDMMIDIGEDLIVPVRVSAGNEQKNSMAKQLIAGGISGIASRTCTAPIDRIKVILQANAGNKSRSGVFSVFKSIFREGGIKSYWRGNGINCVKVAPECALRFAFYERDYKNTTLPERFICGSIAGVGAQLSIYPMEVLKTHLTVAKTAEYNGIFNVFSKIYNKGGIYSLYKGLVPSLLGVFPYSGINLSVYESMKRFYSRNSEKPSEYVPSTAALVTSGAVSSSMGQLASYPFVLLRTNMQLKQNNTHKTCLRNEFSCLYETFLQIVLTNGFKGLYKGMIANYMKMIPSVTIGYVTYEKTKRYLNIS